MDVKPAAVLILLATLLSLAGCDVITGKPNILGTWEADDTAGFTVEFRVDGTVVRTQAGESSTFDYSIDYSTEPIVLTIDGKPGTVTFTDGEHLTTTDDDCLETMSFHRLK